MGSLLKLKTDLKSIKYGHDRAGGGSSGQPYIKTDINTVDKGINKLRFGNFDDGLVRGGVIGMLNSSITDTLRIGKFLTDTPKGPLFIIKQVGLQLSNPRLETKKYSTESSSGFLGSVAKLYDKINDKVGLGPTRLYNLGINTLAQVPINGIGGHIVRHGLLPVADPSKYYEAIVIDNNEKNNRLVKLATRFGLGNPNYKEVSGGNKLIIDDYIGGPGSVYGIGKTLINRAKDRDTSDNSKIRDAFNHSEYQAGKTRASGSLGTGVAEVKIKDTKDFKISNITGSIYNPTKFDNSKFPELNNSFISNIAKGITHSNLGIYNTIRGGSENDVINKGSYTSTNIGTINYQNTYGEVVTIKQPDWSKASREIRVGSGRQDQINLTPIFEAEAGTHIDTVNIPGVGVKNINDLVKFRIQAIDTDTPSSANWMIFRAYLTNLSDSIDAQWSDVKYAGRGDKFYIYDGFNRRMSVSFKVAALSAEEMQPMYQKLNYLMSNLMPDYSNNLMRGPLMRMTIGNYIDGQLCKLDSLSYTIPQDSPWEISLGSQYPQKLELNLPHIIEVQLSFTPIGSQTRNENRLSRKTDGTSHIAQNWNAATESEAKSTKEYVYTPEPKSKSKVDQSNGIKNIEPKNIKAPPATIRTTGIPFIDTLAAPIIKPSSPFKKLY